MKATIQDAVRIIKATGLAPAFEDAPDHLRLYLNMMAFEVEEAEGAGTVFSGKDLSGDVADIRRWVEVGLEIFTSRWPSLHLVIADAEAIVPPLLALRQAVEIVEGLLEDKDPQLLKKAGLGSAVVAYGKPPDQLCRIAVTAAARAYRHTFERRPAYNPGEHSPDGGPFGRFLHASMAVIGVPMDCSATSIRSILKAIRSE